MTQFCTMDISIIYSLPHGMGAQGRLVAICAGQEWLGQEHVTNTIFRTTEMYAQLAHVITTDS